MYYVLLIYADEAEVANAKPGEIESLMEDVDRFDTELTQAGQNLGSIRLRSPLEARILSVREGKRRVTDGPFAETKSSSEASTSSRRRAWRARSLSPNAFRPLDSAS